MNQALQDRNRNRVKDQWQSIMQASEALVLAAEDANWDDLPKHAAYRDRLIRDYYSRPLTVDNALKVREQIQQLLALDERVLGLARRQQTQSRTTLKNLRQGAAAIKAYQG